MASRFKKPNGKYQVRWRDPDGRQRCKETTTLAAARDLVRIVQRSEDLGERYEPRGIRAEPDIEEVAKRWIRDLASSHEASTIEAHGHRLDLFVRWLRTRHRRGPLRLDLLSLPLIKEYHAELDGFEGKRRVLSSRNKYTRSVHQLWRWAFEDDTFGEFTPRAKTLRLKAPPAAHARALPWSDIDRVVGLAHGRHKQLLTVLRYTGLRVDQAMQLEWADFDLGAATLYVRPELGKTRTEKIGRLLPISPHFVAELAGWGVREGFVVPAGLKESREGRGRDVWRFFERAEIDPKFWRQRPHHAFRLAFETNLKAAGVDTEAVEFYVGHDLKIRATYNDPWALPLAELAAAIPKIGEATTTRRLADQPQKKNTAER